ncbi:MAG: hypothetical protein QW751_01540 [Candidatus Aenigmatarchaeota archaeon]|nr:hypothetical protein [Candidatus Aenigmarchaeota archaeon]
MVIAKLHEALTRLEEIIENTVLLLLSIFVIVLAIVALAVFATQPPAGLAERIAVIGAIASLGFLAKAEYFATLLLPWLLMIIGLLVARELWLLRRRIEGIHFEVVLHRLRTAPPRAARRVRKR